MLAVIFVSLFSLLGVGCDSLQGQVSASEVIPAVAQTLPWWVRFVEEDPNCGLKTAKVASNVELEGISGAMGQATWRQTGCRIHLKEPVQLSLGCSGEAELTGTFSITFEKDSLDGFKNLWRTQF